jgi:hypothetical protein
MGMKNPVKPEPADDPEIDPNEMIEASDERVTADSAPEVPAGLEGATEWDTPVSATGTPVRKPDGDDEEAVGTQLVLEGIDEAEREQRIAAAEGDET